MIHPITPGDCARFYCNACLVEFDITLEPKLNEMDNPERAKQERMRMSPQTAAYCPFCGGNDTEQT